MSWGFEEPGVSAAESAARLGSYGGAPIVWGAILLGAKASCIRTPTDSGWAAGSTSWNCSVRTSLGSFRARYTMGSAHRGAPKLADVLCSLALDAQLAEDYPTEEAFLQSGMVGGGADDGDDPRKEFQQARSMLRGCQKARDKLARTLGAFAACAKLEDAVDAAMQILGRFPEIDEIGPSKPLGLLELAAASCASDALCQLLADRDYPLDRLAAAAELCGSALADAEEDPCSRQILISAIETRELRAEIPGPGAARAPRPRAL